MGKFGKIINKIPRQFLSKLPYHTFFLYFFQNMHNSLTKSSRSVHKFSWSGRRKGAISLCILRHPFKLNCCFTVIIAISLIFVLFPPCHHSCEILFSFCAKFKLSCCFGFLCQNFAQIRGVRIRQYRQKFPPGRAGRAFYGFLFLYSPASPSIMVVDSFKTCSILPHPPLFANGATAAGRGGAGSLEEAERDEHQPI